ncbi:chaperonin 10-like protein [Roridomyces roridus]|uniref:Chaperonin 10-like protein n=1 Tax=Roridomyces roridus TaxID=1738132 RepID=A0AAD7B5H3_9AGAR|nr:chaperonin 10-like protein [Roridomyces roridus]
MTSTPQTMLAARYVPGNEKLVLDRAYPIRELKDNEVLLKMVAAGVCHSDTALLSGVGLDTRTSPTLVGDRCLHRYGYVMGHEACGMPVKLGAKVDKHQIHLGQLYSALNLNGCTHGLNGASALLNSFGIGNHGSYAEYYITTSDLLVPVPEGVPPAVAAIASDAGVTAYHAVHHAAQVLIYGVGGVGHLAVQYAKHFGATVYVCDFKPAARQLALELGATEAFDWIELNKRLTAGFTVNTTIDFVATNQTFTTAMATVARNAVDFPVSPRVVLVGISAENLVFNTLAILSSEVQIIGSSYGPRSALVAALDLFAKGTVRAHVSEHPLENVNQIIEELRASDVLGRKVVVARM